MNDFSVRRRRYDETKLRFWLQVSGVSRDGGAAAVPGACRTRGRMDRHERGGDAQRSVAADAARRRFGGGRRGYDRFFFGHRDGEPDVVPLYRQEPDDQRSRDHPADGDEPAGALYHKALHPQRPHHHRGEHQRIEQLERRGPLQLRRADDEPLHRDREHCRRRDLQREKPDDARLPDRRQHGEVSPDGRRDLQRGESIFDA